jgi:alpha-L-rhamnosidase
MWPVLIAQADWFLGRLTGRGLLLAREYTSFDNPFAYITCEGATINAFFYQALRSSEYLAREIGENSQAASYKKAADDLFTRFNEHFWNEKEGAYNSAFMGERIFAPTAHSQLIPLHYGLVPGDREKPARSWFMTNCKNAGPTHVCNNPVYEQMIADRTGINMPIVYFWVFSELYRMNTSAMDLEVLSEIRRRWTPMVKFQQDAGTLSESFTDEYGEGASESCHNYGSVPAWFLSSRVLGVRMDGPVWEKKLLIEPRLGDLTHAEGVVVTEHGAVPVSWKISADGKKLNYSLSVPEGSKCNGSPAANAEGTRIRQPVDRIFRHHRNF